MKGVGGEVLLARQALHAETLTFVHPISRETLSFEAPLAADFAAALAALRQQMLVTEAASLQD